MLGFPSHGARGNCTRQRPPPVRMRPVTLVARLACNLLTCRAMGIVVCLPPGAVIRLRPITSPVGQLLSRRGFGHRGGGADHGGRAARTSRCTWPRCSWMTSPNGLRERPARRVGLVPTRNGGHVAFDLPVRNRSKHVWTFWPGTRRNLSAALAEHYRCAGNKPVPPSPLSFRALGAIRFFRARFPGASQQHCSADGLGDVPW